MHEPALLNKNCMIAATYSANFNTIIQYNLYVCTGEYIIMSG